MRLIFFSFIAFVITFSLGAQDINIEVTKSDVFDYVLKDSYYSTFFYQDSITLFYRSKQADRKGKSELYVKTHDLDFKSERITKSEVGGGDVINTFRNGDSIGLIHRNINKKRNTLEFSISMAKFGEYKFKTRKFFEIGKKQIDNKRFLNALRDQDRNALGKIAFASGLDYFVLSIDLRDKDKEYQKFYVFNIKGKMLYDYDFKRDIKDRNYHLVNFVLSSEDQNIYMLGKTTINVDADIYEINRISKDGILSKELELDGKTIKNIWLYMNNAGMYVYGIYRVKEDKWREGFLFKKYDGDLNLIVDNATHISESFFEDYRGHTRKLTLGERWARGQNIEEDGEMRVYMEKYESITSQGHNYLRYRFKDMFIFKIDKDGNFEWGKSIPKNQFSNRSNRYFSYRSVTVDDYTYFFLNASKVKEEDGELKFVGDVFVRQNLYVIRFDKDGNFDYKKVIDSDDLEYPVQPRAGSYYHDGALYFRSNKGVNHQYIKVNIN